MGRSQLVLDITRPEVRDYIVSSISEVLASANIEYIKWDMNRPLTEVFTQAGGAWQGETWHRYVLGVYDLQRRITTAFPHILLENCASGGGRYDGGMLYFSPQIWCSDNTDALIRMKIQYGTSLAYPARSIGALISSVPNHITGNSTRCRTRALVAMCGTMGFTLDFNDVSPSELLQFREQVRVYKEIAHIVRDGDLYRLWNPFKVSFASWMYVSRDKSEAVVFAFSLNSDHWSNIVPRLTCKGLLPDAEYEITEPLPNNVEQRVDNLRIVESTGNYYILLFGMSSKNLLRSSLPAGLSLRLVYRGDAYVRRSSN